MFSDAGSRQDKSFKELLTVQQFHGQSGQPQKSGKEGRQDLIIGRNEASSLTEQLMFFSSFIRERSRVWAGDTGKITYDFRSHSSMSRGLNVACV